MTKIFRAIRAWLDRIFDPETPFDLYEMSDDVSQRVKDQTDEIWFDRLAGRGDASENDVPDEIKMLRMRTSVKNFGASVNYLNLFSAGVGGTHRNIGVRWERMMGWGLM